VGNRDGGASVRHLVDGLLDDAFGDGVQGGGGLVQQQHGRILEQHPGDRDALFLTTGQPVTALTHHGVVTVLEAGDDVMDVRGGADLDEFLVGRIRLGVPQVLGDGRVEQVGLLGHDADVVDDRGRAERAYVGTCEADDSRRGLVQPRRQIQDGGLARAGWPYQGDMLSGLDGEADVVQGRAGVWRRVRVAEGHIVELDAAPRPGRLGDIERVGDVADRRHQIEVLEDAGEQRPGGLQVQRHPHEPDQRVQQTSLNIGERHDGTGGDADIATDDEPARDHIDDRRDRRHEHLHDREETLPAHGTPDLEAYLVGVLRAVALRLRPLPVERLGQQDSGDRQRLLRDGGELRQRLLGLPGDPGADHADPTLDEDQDRHHDHRDDGQAPVDENHCDQRGDHGDGVAEDRGERRGEHSGHSAHVVLQTGLDDSGLGAGEEGQLHGLQMLEQSHP